MKGMVKNRRMGHGKVNKKVNKKRAAKKKKIFAFLFIAVICVSFLPASVWAKGSYPTTSPEGSRGPGTAEIKDPIAASTGEYYFSKTFISLGGLIPLDFTLEYSPHMRLLFTFAEFPLPLIFVSNTWIRLVKFTTPETEYVNIQFLHDALIFKKNASADVWESQMEVKYQLKGTEHYFYMMDPTTELVYVFDIDRWERSGRVLRVMDRNGNKLTYSYNSDGQPTRIEDGLGRALNLNYNVTTHYLSEVNDSFGRTITFNYETMPIPGTEWIRIVLTSVTDHMGNTTQFRYQYFADSGWSCYRYMTNQMLPEGNIPYEQTWEEKNLSGGERYRVVSQTDAYGNTVILSYNESSGIVTVTNPDGTERVFKHESGRWFKSRTDETGKIFTLDHDASHRPTRITDRFGDTTNITYYPQSGKIASITNAKGDVLRYTYTAQDQTFTNPDSGEQFSFTFYNLARIDYPDGTNETFTYDAKGNMLTHIDRAGEMWSYEYNGRGAVTKAINPLGGETIYTYNSDGTVSSSHDSDTGLTNFSYDAYKRITRITYPDGAFAQIAYDLNDHITSVTDQNGRIYRYKFDKNGNLAQELDPDGCVTSYEYDLMDRLTKLTNRLGGATSFSYDSMDRIAAITDPNGDSIHFDYDIQSRFVNITDEAGKVWRKKYDEEWLLSSITTPLGRTTTFERDEQGRITRMTDPLGGNTTFTRDQMGKVTVITDSLGRQTTFGDNGNDFLQSVTKPVVGTVTYARNDMGLYTEISDTRDKKWLFTYTPMGRTSSYTDPLGNTWQYEYDDLGQFNRTLFPTGETLEKSYDHGGNLLRESWSDGTDIQYIYDSSYRLISTNGLNFSHNDAGMVTNTNNSGISFSATYDKEKKLTAVTYNNGAFNITYEYDSRDSLTKVKDNLTNTEIIFNYDDDGRLIGMNRSNGVNSEITRDDASRITRIKNGAFSDQQYTLDAAGQITQAVLDVPSDPAGVLTSRTDYFTYDDASQVNSSGYSYDARGRQTASPTNSFTWDGAGRLKAIGPTALEYNGLGGLMARTEGGHKTSYYYNYAIGLLPIVAEKNETTSQWKRFYVWTPGGSLLYFIDAQKGNKVYFYHFDPLGNTLFLTDSSGTVTDSYAYSPYGLLLAHNGTSAQPFTFVGQFGVRAEGEFGIYQMGMRYYDSVTARFLSRDPAWPVTDDPFSLNPYQYANQNPFMYIDPTGQGVGLSTGSFVVHKREDKDCPIPCKGVCKRVEVNKVMLVMGSDKGWIPGHYIRHSYRWARDYLRKKCGKKNVIVMRKPTWKCLKDTLNANKNDLAALVFIGHGESHAGIDINNNDRGDVASSGWFENPMSGASIPDVYFFACHQGEKSNAQRWANVFGSRNFHSYDGAGNPYAMYYSHINHVKKITCAKTWKWICVQVADTSKPVPPAPVRTVGDRIETYLGKREAVTKFNN